MRQFTFITVHPDFVASYSQFGVMKAASEKQICSLHFIDLRDFAVDKHGSIDAPPFGGGDGMVLRIEPLVAALQQVHPQLAVVKSQRQISASLPLVVCPTPSGKWFHHADSVALSLNQHDLVFICGRFAGIDQRFLDHFVDIEYSLGDFVISGGELASLAIADSVLRQIPGVLGHGESAQNDSFAEGTAGLLEASQYTRPQDYHGLRVPEALLSGHHGQIATWRQEDSLAKTKKRRPDLLK